jgi:hypothetical protein
MKLNNKVSKLSTFLKNVSLKSIEDTSLSAIAKSKNNIIPELLEE